MRSADEMLAPGYSRVSAKQKLARGLTLWTRRLHFYTGLYFIFFLWLFTLTGLVINHPKWTFAEFWPQRKEVHFERAVLVHAGASADATALDLMRQLDIRGEIDWNAPRQQDGHFDFRVSRPGHLIEVRTDVAAGRARVTEISLNAWGTMGLLHRFNGVHPGDALNSRDWLLTTLWTVSMDALCLGLIFMVGSGIYVWYRSRRRRVSGFATLAIGSAICAFFLFALVRL